MTCETAHHYILGEPVGLLVAGECKRCGHTREWSVWPEGLEANWNDHTPYDKDRARRRRAKVATRWPHSTEVAE